MIFDLTQVNEAYINVIWVLLGQSAIGGERFLLVLRWFLSFFMGCCGLSIVIFDYATAHILYS